jgi:hypothetical protein
MKRKRKKRKINIEKKTVDAKENKSIYWAKEKKNIEKKDKEIKEKKRIEKKCNRKKNEW